ncbi:MAG TPA: hypothetical protein PK413_18410, partial [Thermoanaerobaculia bacterium]|nr:hypothetical protein [Thermoanaerobaculia bacterium]
DAVGMCRFDTKLFNSPTLPDPADFAEQVKAHLPLLKIVRRTGQDFAAESDLCAPLVRLLWRARQWKEAHAGVS